MYMKIFCPPFASLIAPSLGYVQQVASHSITLLQNTHLEAGMVVLSCRQGRRRLPLCCHMHTGDAPTQVSIPPSMSEHTQSMRQGACRSRS